MGFDVAIALTFFVLAFWTAQKPYTALLTATIVYVSLIIIEGILDPSTQFKGLIGKITVIVLLIKGIVDARQAQEVKDAFDQGQ